MVIHVQLINHRVELETYLSHALAIVWYAQVRVLFIRTIKSAVSRKSALL